MKAAAAVESLGALAHRHRLAAYRLLVQAGPPGLPAGAIANRLGVGPSSLTFHIQALLKARLVSQRRAGRQLFYAADFAAMNSLVLYLTEKCCGGDASCAPPSKPAARQAAARPTASRRR